MLLGSARYFLVSTFLSGGSQSVLQKENPVKAILMKIGIRQVWRLWPTVVQSRNFYIRGTKWDSGQSVQLCWFPSSNNQLDPCVRFTKGLRGPVLTAGHWEAGSQEREAKQQLQSVLWKKPFTLLCSQGLIISQTCLYFPLTLVQWERMQDPEPGSCGSNPTTALASWLLWAKHLASTEFSLLME